MTTRDQARRGLADRTDSRPGFRVDPAPTLSERLLAARERKGVDLYRAERDTKIRARYLAALERGDFRELPGTVYTKGFLRNYALYLGLDPDEVLGLWFREAGARQPAEQVIVAPRALEAPRRGFVLSRGLIVAGLLLAAIVVFLGYLGLQVFRFAQPPGLTLSDPPTAVSTVDESATTYDLAGLTIPNGTVSVESPGRDTVRVSANGTGVWIANVDLRRGRNQFDLSALDPDTGRKSQETLRIFITVPLSAVLAPTLELDSPADGASFENGAIPVVGTATSAKTVTVSATYVGPAAGAAPAPAPSPPAPSTVDVASDGSFTVPVDLSAGRWTLTITATSEQNKATTLTRNVTIAYEGVNVVVAIKGGRAWLRVWVDGELETRLGEKTYNDGRKITITGKTSVEVRTGNASVTYYTLNGRSVGRLGRSSNPETWLFAPPDAPRQTSRK